MKQIAGALVVIAGLGASCYFAHLGWFGTCITTLILSFLSSIVGD